jgi:exosortase/archaeosortase family protein
MTTLNESLRRNSMQETAHTKNENITIAMRVLPALAFTVPFLVQWFLYPNSFETTEKDRMFYILFVWLAFLEAIMSWEKLQTNKLEKLRSSRTIAFLLSLLLPTIYLIVSNNGLSSLIISWAGGNGTTSKDWIPLSIKYALFPVFFFLIVYLEYGKTGLKSFLLSPLFLATVGAIYTIAYMYPYGAFTPFQILVPATTRLASAMLNIMGYQTQWKGDISSMPVLQASNSKGSATFAIAWPCSGIESLLIYTVTILLFLKNTSIPWKQRAVYFVIGAIVTFFINALRIVTIFVIAIDTGTYPQWFHDFYGSLYSIAWIISYPLIIIGSRLLWGRIFASRRTLENYPSQIKTTL